MDRRAGINNARRTRARYLRFLRALSIAVLLHARGAAPVFADTHNAAGYDDLLDPGEPADGGFPDPIESFNRGILEFNTAFDKWLLDPVTKVYRFLIPDIGRRAITRVFVNFNAVPVLINDGLQREWEDMATTFTRFALNSTFGLAGFIDVASAIGLTGHQSDFGQTLALAGVRSGPYLILPLLGPSTLRDATGTLVDFTFRPSTYLLGGSDQIAYTMIYAGGYGISSRDANADALRLLHESSVDFYAALRSAYYQTREAEIWTRREQHRARRRNGAPPLP